jgi:hypothetical protein
MQHALRVVDQSIYQFLLETPCQAALDKYNASSLRRRLKAKFFKNVD